MSIQAVAWVLRDKNVPGFARLVLISLANHADDESGHCWPSVAKIAKEALISPRSVHTYLGALRRNGYIMIESGRSRSGKQRSNNYWILFDRPNSPWEWSGADDAKAQDVDETESISAAPADTEVQHLSASGADIADGLSANTLQTIEPPESKPSESSFTDSENPPRIAPVETPQALARRESQEKLRAAEEARSKKQPTPVVEGSDPWKSWVKHGHSPDLTTWVIFQGKQRRGWYFPQLYPPKSTGPPADFEPMNELEAELAKED